ncbi:MAG: glycosyltransferase family 1 protein [Geobacteraceae bacterium]|nr:glycosyltransferase family 1 protein [Geobacteraceae bacterium]
MNNRFNIYIDCIVFDIQRMGGISIYVSELIKRFLVSGLDVAFLEQESLGSNLIRNELPIPANKIILLKSIVSKIARYLPITLKLENRSIVHSSYYRICNNAFAANVVTVYDFNYDFGYVRRGIRKHIHCFQKKNAVFKADGVVCISESTKLDLLRLYKGVDPGKIRVIYLAASDDFYKIPLESKSSYNEHRFKNYLDKNYVLFVGARVHHKNFDICVDTLVKLQTFELVIVGSKLTVEEIKTLDMKLPSKYHALADASATDLNCLYNNAYCLLYPSSYEGFGIPVLEAMQAGCPVVSTTFSSIPEVAGIAGLLVNDVCPDAFVEKILSLEDASYRDKVISAGFEQAKKFSWDKTYQETVAFYHEVINNKFGESRSSN